MSADSGGEKNSPPSVAMPLPVRRSETIGVFSYGEDLPMRAQIVEEIGLPQDAPSIVVDQEWRQNVAYEDSPSPPRSPVLQRSPERSPSPGQDAICTAAPPAVSSETGWKRSTIKLALPVSITGEPPPIRTRMPPPVRDNSDRLRARKRFIPHRAPEVVPSQRYLMGVSGATSILTPRFVVSEEASGKPSPSAEELNELIRQSDASLDGPAARVETPPIAGISVAIVPASRPGVVSVDGRVPTTARAVCSPLGVLAPRPGRVNLSAASLNIDTYGIYESAISPPDNRDYVFETRGVGIDDAIAGSPIDIRDKVALANDGTYHGGMHVSVSMTVMLMINTYRAVGSCVRLSPAFLYYNRKNRPVHGMNGRDALRLMYKVGIAESDAWSWTGDDYYAPPITESSYRTARRHRVVAYMAVASKLGLLCALRLVGACYILLPLFGMRPRFWCTDSEDTRGRVLGVQSAVVVGWVDSGFIITVWNDGWVGDRTMILPWVDWDSVIECWAAPVSVEALHVSDYIGSMICVPAHTGIVESTGELTIVSSESPAFEQPDKKDTVERRGGCTIV